MDSKGRGVLDHPLSRVTTTKYGAAPRVTPALVDLYAFSAA